MNIDYKDKSNLIINQKGPEKKKKKKILKSIGIGLSGLALGIGLHSTKIDKKNTENLNPQTTIEKQISQTKKSNENIILTYLKKSLRSDLHNTLIQQYNNKKGEEIYDEYSYFYTDLNQSFGKDSGNDLLSPFVDLQELVLNYDDKINFTKIFKIKEKIKKGIKKCYLKLQERQKQYNDYIPEIKRLNRVITNSPKMFNLLLDILINKINNDPKLNEQEKQNLINIIIKYYL